MIDALTMARKLTASFSNRVASRRHSFSQPMQHSMMLRRRYASRSKLSGRPRCRASWSERWGITAPTAWRRSQVRILSTLYALSPATRLGRERGGPRGWGIRTASISASNWVDSCLWPAVASTARGRPRPSVTRWSFVPNPPRERPRAWSGGSSVPPFCPLQRLPGLPESSCRRRTTGPNRSGPLGPAASAGPGASDPRCRPDATG
jgi:hypothetical protein